MKALTKEQAMVDVARLAREYMPDRAEAIVEALEAQDGPPAELLACIEAAKSGAKFRVEMEITAPRGRRTSPGRWRCASMVFDSRDPAPPPPRLPHAAEEANEITFRNVPHRPPRR